MKYLTAILGITLFVPTIFYNQIFLINILIISYAVFINKEKLKNSMLFLILILLGFISFLFKAFFFNSLEDFNWFLRYYQFLMVVLYCNSLKVESMKYFYYLLYAYATISLIFAFMETLRMHDTVPLQFLKNYYWKEVHSLVTYRAKGLNAGPGQFTKRAFFLLMIFGHIIISRKGSFLHYFFFFSSIAMVIMSGSRTGFVLVAILSLAVFSFSKNKLISITVLGFSALFGLFNVFNFARVSRLFETGVTEDSSALSRFAKWDLLFNETLKMPFLVVTGWTETMFSKWDGGVIDNEFISIFLYFGIFGILIFLIFQYNLFSKFLALSEKNYHKIFFIILFFSISLFQFFSSFYTDPIALIFVYLLYYQQLNIEKFNTKAK